MRGRTTVLVGIVLLIGGVFASASRPPEPLRGTDRSSARLPAPSASATRSTAAPQAMRSATPVTRRAVAVPASKPAPLKILTAVKRSGTTLPPHLADLASRAESALGGIPVSGPAGIVRPTADSVVVEIRMKSTDPASVGRLTESGAKILDVSGSLHSVTASVRTMHLDAVAKTDGVVNVQEAFAPFTSQTSASPAATSTTAPSCTPIVSEGDTQLKAALARTHFHIDGTGTTVGVVSDSFDRDPNAPTHASDDVATGALPGTANPCGYTTPVQVVDDSAPAGFASDEGRAMAQIVHGLAPGAKLAFATGCCTQSQMAHNILALAGAGAKVIVDDLAFATEPVYQDGPIAAAVAQVRSQGVTYVSAAGNSNVRIDGRDIGSYETPAYRGMVCPLPTPYVDCHDFGGNNFEYGVTLAPHGAAVYELQWAQPWFGVTTDLDLIAIDDSNKVVGVSSFPNTGANGTQVPFEIVPVENPSSAPLHVKFIVGRVTGPDVRFKLFALGTPPGMITSVDHATGSNGDVVGPTIFGHNGSANAITVGAVRYDTTAAPEAYASRGPVTEYFAAVNGTTPAQALKTALRLDKPDIAASDCVRTTFFSDFDGTNYRFCGTSAAAPHAAAIAALARQKLTGSGPSDIRTALDASAVDIAPTGHDELTGFGLIDADAALSVLRIIPFPSPTAPPTITAAPSTKPTLTLSTEQPRPGAVLTVKGSHFAAHTLYNIYLHSTPVFLGSTPTSSSGDFSIDLFVPDSVTVGAHLIEVRKADDNALAATAPVTVLKSSSTLASVSSSAPSRLPRTGGDIARMFLLGLLTLLAGASLIVWSRRESLRFVLAKKASRGSVYAMLARGAGVLPEITRIERTQEQKRS